MEDLEFNNDETWKPWYLQSAEREVTQAVIPEGKEGKFVVCSKHNKVRAIMTCERIVGEDGIGRTQCKATDECFSIASRKGDGERGLRGRYFFLKRENNERVCYVCTSPEHDAADCPCVPCKRCFNSLESHLNIQSLCQDIFPRDFLTWLSTVEKNSAKALTCISCGKTQHADCSAPYKPKSRTCLSCGNVGHYCMRCKIRSHNLQIQRDKGALDAMSPDTITSNVSISSRFTESNSHPLRKRSSENAECSSKRKAI